MSKRSSRAWELTKASARESPKLFALYFVLRAFVLGLMVFSILNSDVMNTLLCILTLVLFSIPTFIEHRIKIDIPNTLEVMILLSIFAAEVLGEINEYYVNVPYWDTMLHTVNGFLSAAIGMALIDVLNKNGKLSISMSPLFVALFALCFSITVGVVWEFYEFGSDMLFRSDMQKDTWVHTISSVTLHPGGKNIPVVVSGITETVIRYTDNGVPAELVLDGYLDIGIIDTMRDLIVNFIGASIFSIIGGFYIKHRGEGASGRFIRRFLLARMDDDTRSILDDDT